MKSNEIGTRLKALREEKGLTQQQLANLIGMTCSCSRQTVVAWENGTRNISTDCLLRIVDIFDTSCDYLLRGIETPNVDFCRKTGLSQSAIHSLSALQSERQRIIRNMQQIIDKYVSDCSELNSDSNPDCTNIMDFNTGELPPHLAKLADKFWMQCNTLRQKLYIANVRIWIINSFLNNSVFVQELSETATDALSCVTKLLEEILLSSELVTDYSPPEDTLTLRAFEKDLNSCRYAASISFSKFFESCSKDANLVLNGYKDDPESDYYRNLLSFAYKYGVYDSNGQLSQ